LEDETSNDVVSSGGASAPAAAAASSGKGKWKMMMSMSGKTKLTTIIFTLAILVFLWRDAVLETKEAALLKKHHAGIVNSYFVNDPNVMCGCMTISMKRSLAESSRKKYEQVAFPVKNPNCPRESFEKKQASCSSSPWWWSTKVSANDSVGLL
jgi:hypothetical protein